MPMILSLVVGLIVTVALWAVSGSLLLGAAWSSLHSGRPDPGAPDLMLNAFFLLCLVVPPALGVFSGRWTYRRMNAARRTADH